MPSKTPSPTPKSSSTQAPSKLGPVLVFLKLVAIPLGFVATVVSLMAGVGVITTNFYVRAAVAIILALGLPLALADKLLPKDNATSGNGIVTDVLAIFLLAVPLTLTAAVRYTAPVFIAEGDRLTSDGYEPLANVAYLLGNVRPERPASATNPTTETVDAGTDATTTTETDANAPPDASIEVPAAVVVDASPDVEAPKDPKPRPTSEKTPAELFREWSPAVVTIFVKKGDAEGGGTGFLIDEYGTIITNHHVVEGAQYAKIKFQNGASYENIDVLVDDRTADLAILSIDLKHPLEGGAPPTDAKPIRLGDSDKIAVGERAIAIGNPLGLEHTLTDGLISARRLYEGKQWIQISVPISPGNSGGPLFNMHGEVVGIITAQLGGPFARAQNLNLAVPVDDLKRLMKPSYPNKRKIGEPNTFSGQW
jgi:S1-C subfamily serine protease